MDIPSALAWPPIREPKQLRSSLIAPTTASCRRRRRDEIGRSPKASSTSTDQPAYQGRAEAPSDVAPSGVVVEDTRRTGAGELPRHGEDRRRFAVACLVVDP